MGPMLVEFGAVVIVVGLLLFAINTVMTELYCHTRTMLVKFGAAIGVVGLLLFAFGVAILRQGLG
jgi:hypothetical protein